MCETRLMINKGRIFLLALLFVLLAFIPKGEAQYFPYYTPFYNFYSFGYPFFGYPLFAPTTSPLLASGFRYANVPLTSSSLFPAPVLPTVPSATTGGVGITTLIPSVPVTQVLPLNSLITTPLAGLITFTPLSLVGLTFAPVPVTATTIPLSFTLPVAAPTVTTTLAPTTSTAIIISLLSNLLI